jgi:capsule polysaccharide export protein KpsE/RkpR
MALETQHDMTLLEGLLKVVNSCLSHKRLFVLTVFIPTLVAFIMVMWVIKPTYAAEAVVTPPTNGSALSGGLGKLLEGSGSMSFFSSFMGGSSEGSNIVWTYFNSWELHNKVIEKFDLAKHYEFEGDFHADLLKQFRRNFSLEKNEEEMFHIVFADEDYKLASRVLTYMLDQVDSMYNNFKTTQARQSRTYMNQRLAEVEHRIDSLESEFVNFQETNHIYDPNVQTEGTMKYLSGLQVDRDAVYLALSKEKKEHGENTRQFQDLQNRLRDIDAAKHQTLGGRHSNIGVVALNKVPKLSAEYARMEKELKLQAVIYALLKQESERLYIEESNLMSNLVVLQPPWENNKKIKPLRGVTLIFVFSISFVFAIFLCCFLEYWRGVNPESSLGIEIKKFSQKVRFKS